MSLMPFIPPIGAALSDWTLVSSAAVTTFPTVQDGDIAIAIRVNGQDTGGVADTPPLASGWTQLDYVQSNDGGTGSHAGARTMWRVLSASDSGTSTGITVSPTTSDAIMVIFRPPSVGTPAMNLLSSGTSASLTVTGAAYGSEPGSFILPLAITIGVRTPSGGLTGHAATLDGSPFASSIETVKNTGNGRYRANIFWEIGHAKANIDVVLTASAGGTRRTYLYNVRY